MTFARFLMIACLMLLQTPARAVLTIDVVQGAEGAIPIAVTQFGDANLPEDIAQIIRNDLAKSGRFAPLPPASLPQHPSDTAQVNFPLWQNTGSRYLVIGQVEPDPSGVARNTGVAITFHLLEVFDGKSLAGLRYTAPMNGLRQVAHRIADAVYAALTDEKGAFNSRVAYVTLSTNRKQYLLEVADSDGMGGKTILTSAEPILSPAWSPDGQRLAYVSLEGKKNAVYVQDVASGKRTQVAAWPGLNGAPAWAPDGRRLALSMSKDGNPEIYVLDVASRDLRRLTNHPAIDTEPAWTPDGSTIAFTSDRGGNPQVYQVSAQGGNAARLTFEGSYNARPSFSADGSKLLFIHGDGRTFGIAVMNTQGGGLQVLTGAGNDESPSFAPNGSMVIFATGRELAAVSIDGKVRQRLMVTGAEVREPAWSPLNP